MRAEAKRIDEDADRELRDLRTLDGAAAVAQPAKPGGLPDVGFRDWSQLTSAPAPTEFLIDGVLPARQLVVVAGQAKSLKSFIVQGMGCCIAAGVPWHGRPVRQGPVIYCCGEGHAAIGKRLLAWETVNGAPAHRPMLVTTAAHALNQRTTAFHVGEAIAAASNRIGGSPALVIVDTFARHFAGDENDAGEVGEFMNAIDEYIRHRFDCTLTMVHHTGHGPADRPRGSSAIRPALDLEYLVRRDGMRVTLEATVAKDIAEPEPLTLEARVVELPPEWNRANGSPETSLVLHYLADAPVIAKHGLGANQRAALSKLQALLADQSQRLEQGGYSGSTARVLIEDWRMAVSPDRRRWPEVINGLVSAGAIRLEHPYVIPIEGPK